MIYTKPCARSGCRNDCKAFTPSQHARRRWCSNRCAALDRYAHGRKPPRLTREQYAAAGRAGGRQAGIVRRRQATLRVVTAVSRLVSAQLREELTRAGLLRWQAVLARAYRAGRTAERSRLRMLLRSNEKAAA